MDRHKRTQKHQAKEQQHELSIDAKVKPNSTVKQPKLNIDSTSDRVNVFSCRFCGKSFPFYQSMWRHEKKTCTKSNTIESQEVTKIESKIVNNMENDKPNFKKLEEENKELKEQNKLLLDLAMQNSKTAAGSVRTMTYAMRHLKNAPEMKLLEGNEAIKLLTYDNKKSPHDAIETIIRKHKNKLLDKHLGNIIVNAYKKDDPELQSFWGVDTSRLHFILKQGQWVSDKSGTKLNELIIDPFLCKVDDMIREYISERTKSEYNKDKKYTPSSLGNFPANFVYCNEILIDISKNKLHKKILQNISPHFELTTKDIDTVIANKIKNKHNDDTDTESDNTEHYTETDNTETDTESDINDKTHKPKK